jgi:hypothetical protein
MSKLKSLAGLYYNKLYYSKYGSILKEHTEKIKKYKDLHKDKRCFIIGTGPSIKNVNFSLIKNEILIGTNTLYRGIENFKIKPQYWGCVDSIVLDAHYKSMFNLKTKLFLAGSAGRKYLSTYQDKPANADIMVLKNLSDIIIWNKMGKDITHGVYGGGNVISDVCLHIAYYMGCNPIYLLGVDYSNLGVRWDGLLTENKKGLTENIYNKCLKSFDILNDIFKQDGRTIINLSEESKVTAFKKEKLEDII